MQIAVGLSAYETDMPIFVVAAQHEICGQDARASSDVRVGRASGSKCVIVS